MAAGEKSDGAGSRLSGKKYGAVTSRTLFGVGGSEAEKAGRKVAHAFRQGVIEGLSPAQMAEVQKSWKAGWDSSVKVAVRDAEIASGKAVEAAIAAGEAAFQALWRAEKEGPEAVKRAQHSIQAILDAGTAATKAAIALEQERQEVAIALEKERQKAALDALEEMNAARLKTIKDAQAIELSELRATQQRELDELASARQAQLSVVESAIRRELEDERIKAQLKIDILPRRAGKPKRYLPRKPARLRRSSALVSATN